MFRLFLPSEFKGLEEFKEDPVPYKEQLKSALSSGDIAALLDTHLNRWEQCDSEDIKLAIVALHAFIQHEQADIEAKEQDFLDALSTADEQRQNIEKAENSTGVANFALAARAFAMKKREEIQEIQRLLLVREKCQTFKSNRSKYVNILKRYHEQLPEMRPETLCMCLQLLNQDISSNIALLISCTMKENSEDDMTWDIVKPEEKWNNTTGFLMNRLDCLLEPTVYDFLETYKLGELEHHAMFFVELAYLGQGNVILHQKNSVVAGACVFLAHLQQKTPYIYMDNELKCAATILQRAGQVLGDAGDYFSRRYNSLVLPSVFAEPIPPCVRVASPFISYGDMTKYVGEQTIGKGAYGLVSKYTDTKTSKTVAIKKMVVKEMFKYEDFYKTPREISILKLLGVTSSPVVEFLNYSITRNSIYIVSEIADGDVKSLIETNMFMGKKLMILDAITQIINGVAYCHDHCIMHRDIKPDNVLFFKRGDKYTYKITDFGLARPFISGRAYSLHVITRWYRGPELTFQRYDESCDVWSIGVLSSELILSNVLVRGIKAFLVYFASPDEDDHFKFLCQTFGFPSGQHWAMSNRSKYPKELRKWQRWSEKQDFSRGFQDNCFERAKSISPKLEDVIRRMLIMDYTQRITMKEALLILKN